MLHGRQDHQAADRSVPEEHRRKGEQEAQREGFEAHPVWHINHAFVSNEFQYPTVRLAPVPAVLHLKQHRIVDVQLGCKAGRAWERKP
jgi:hypothetical protein